MPSHDVCPLVTECARSFSFVEAVENKSSEMKVDVFIIPISKELTQILFVTVLQKENTGG